MKKNENGFSVVELLVVILVVVLIGGVGWYALHRQDNKDTSGKNSQTAEAKMITYTDSSKTFSLQYPDSWSIIPYEPPGHDNPTTHEPDWTKTPQPITLRNGSNQSAKILIEGDLDGNTTIDKEMAGMTHDQFSSHTMLTINGVEAMKHVLDFVGPSDAEKYKDTMYVLVSEGRKVTLRFRERYSNVTLNGQNDFDAAAQAPDFEKIAKSITF